MNITKEIRTAVAITGGIIAIISFMSIGVSVEDAMNLQTLKLLIEPRTIILLLISGAGTGMMLASLRDKFEKKMMYTGIVASALSILMFLTIPEKIEAGIMALFTVLGLIAFALHSSKNTFIYILAAGALISGILVVQANPEQYQESFKKQIGTIAGNMTNSMQNILTKDDIRSMIEDQKMSRDEIEKMVLSSQGISGKSDLMAKFEEEYAETYGDLWDRMSESKKTEIITNATNTAWDSIQKTIDEQYNAQSDPERIEMMVNSTYATLQDKITNENSSIQKTIGKITEKVPFFKTLLSMLPLLYGLIAFTAVTIYGVIVSPFYWLFGKLFRKNREEKKIRPAKIPREISPEEQKEKTFEIKKRVEEETKGILQKGRAYKEEPAAEHKKLKL